MPSPLASSRSRRPRSGSSGPAGAAGPPRSRPPPTSLDTLAAAGRSTARMKKTWLAASCLAFLVIHCRPKAEERAVTQTAAAKDAAFDRVPRLELNRLAAELDLPLFWFEDKNG